MTDPNPAISGLKTNASLLGTGSSALPDSGIASNQSDFSRILGKARDNRGKDPAQVAKETAEEFVSITMIQPLLAQLRSTNQAAAPFAPSSGEKQFQTMLDAHLAQQIVRAKQFPLVDSVARKLLRSGQGTQDASSPQTARSSHEQVNGSEQVPPTNQP